MACTIGNVAQEAVAEVLPLKELFTSVVPGQDHRAAAIYILFSCLLQLIILAMKNSGVNATNSRANAPNFIAKASNSIAKAMI